MKIDPKTTSNQTIQSLNDQLGKLADEAKEVNRDIDKTNREASEQMKAISSEIDESIKKVKVIFSELDQIEAKAGDELDRLVLERAEDLASE